MRSDNMRRGLELLHHFEFVLTGLRVVRDGQVRGNEASTFDYESRRIPSV